MARRSNIDGTSPAGGPRELRIVGGRLRGRKFRFAACADIRPTPNRIRETLFNWLAPHIEAAACLDLFAGSGALGLEALSRGAGNVVFVDDNRAAVDALRTLTREWGLSKVETVHGDALRYLARPPLHFDIVFLDPPFAGDLQQQCLAQLAAGAWVATGGFVYLEQPRRAPAPVLPVGWQAHRAGHAGEVGYHLYRAHGGADSRLQEVSR